MKEFLCRVATGLAFTFSVHWWCLQITSTEGWRFWFNVFCVYSVLDCYVRASKGWDRVFPKQRKETA